MSHREDGKKTRTKILEAACQVFAEKGYHAAKVAEICQRANVNIASVNYYFGGKASLYMEAWKAAFHKHVVPVPVVSQSLSPEEKLRFYIETLLQDFVEKGAQGLFTRLYLMELVHPTGLIQDIWLEMIEPRRQVLLDIIREIAGKGVSPETVSFCEMSIVSQCRTLLTLRRNDLEYLLDQPFSPSLIQRLARHITRFSLAGIREVSGSSQA